jgi:glyoxylase-like metal-dependent hydrolase (beta-lactamase superfamily II)
MQITKHCYAITGLYFLPPWGVNSGFITGESKTLIIDTGGCYSSANTIYGYAKGIKPDNELIVINTEKHLDHISGNILFFKKGIKIYGHENIARKEEDLFSMMNDFNRVINDEKRKLNHEEQILFEGTEIINPEIKLNCDCTIDLGELSVNIIMTPGHTDTNLSVYFPEEKVLYSGDCVLPDFLPNTGEGDEKDWQIWSKSLEKIKNLQLEYIIPGHGSVIEGNSSILKEIMRIEEYLKSKIGQKNN